MMNTTPEKLRILDCGLRLACLRAPSKQTTVAQGSGFRAADVCPEPTAQNPEPERPEVMLIGALKRIRNSKSEIRHAEVLR